MLLRFLAAAVIAVVVHAEAQVQGVVATFGGFIHTNGALRPILGVPGAAHIGPPVVEGLESAWPAPNRRWAFGTNADGTILLRGLETSEVRSDSDSRLLTDISKLVWNARGDDALLFSAISNRIQRVHVTENSISPEPAISLAPIGSGVSVLAIDAARRIAVAIDGSGVYVAGYDAALYLAAPLERVSAMAFAPGGSLLAADASTQSIYAIDDPGAASQPRKIVENCTDVIGIIGGDQRLHVVSAAGRNVRTYDMSGALQSDLALERTPTALSALSQDSTFLLNGIEGNQLPVMVLDVKAQPAVLFVPAGDVSTL